MVHDQKVLSFVMNRAQVLYKAVSKPPRGLTDVEEATIGAADAVDPISGCAGEPVSDVEGLFGSLEGGIAETLTMDDWQQDLEEHEMGNR
eukprot:g19910.t1